MIVKRVPSDRVRQHAPAYLPSVGRLLEFSARLASTLSTRRLKPYGLTLKQWVPLTALWRASPIVESELAAYCRLSASALNRLLDRMESKGLVARHSAKDDRRRVIVSVGPIGQDLAHLLDFFVGINDTLLDGFSPEERTQLSNLLTRLITNAERTLASDDCLRNSPSKIVKNLVVPAITL